MSTIISTFPDIDASNKLDIVDCHHHLWDISSNNYPWLRPVDQGGTPSHLAGDINKLKKSYLIDDYLYDTRNFNLLKSVHVQAEYDHQVNDGCGEVEYLQHVADQSQYPQGIVAYANLSSPTVEHLFQKYTTAYRNVKGIRQLLNYIEGKPSLCMIDRGDYLKDQKWLEGFSLLDKYNLSYDLHVYQSQMVDAAELARQYPHTPIILDHCGLPYGGDTLFDDWKQNMAILAQQSNVSCKISGLVMFQHNWSLSTLKPYVDYCLNIFGSKRCMFASNFPVDKLNATFDELFEAYFKLATEAGLTSEEIKQVFCQNAVNFYRLK
ncbi:unnamed protein product [Didymodactylos carnosus]|uniref:Amidohydrolase-related domain-containing protein n=1 Tax=Didymodactylos carnosus TaxID=1234261 RepID=A0A814W8N4_9BILA|nr:unnamed protein product [Didymodactylos carnosus]CAF1201762.1 unnamed protein product [Didymodactylos carnosus]CAF3553823.1 unnamed protein product [Didymodactylos carnosus]CAF3966224.1 unnamed protein product [Didymodactylos carnosus]